LLAVFNSSADGCEGRKNELIDDENERQKKREKRKKKRRKENL